MSYLTNWKSGQLNKYTKLRPGRLGFNSRQWRGRVLSPRHRVQTGSETHPASYPTGTVEWGGGGGFPPQIRTWAWSWPLIYNLVSRLMCGAMPALHRTSRSGASCIYKRWESHSSSRLIKDAHSKEDASDSVCTSVTRQNIYFPLFVF
jgi:hypothetical protein